MKLPMSCMTCFTEDGQPRTEMMLLELRDDGLYTSTCDRGHTTVTAIQEEKFEILFDVAAMALLDGLSAGINCRHGSGRREILRTLRPRDFTETQSGRENRQWCLEACR